MSGIYRVTKQVLAYNPLFNSEEAAYYHTLTTVTPMLYIVLSKPQFNVSREELRTVLQPLFNHANWYSRKKRTEDARPTDINVLFGQMATVVDPLLKKYGLLNRVGLIDSLPKELMVKLPSNPMMQNPKITIPSDQMIPTKDKDAPGFDSKEEEEDVINRTKERFEKFKRYRDSNPPKNSYRVIDSIVKKGEAVTEDIQNPLRNAEDLKEVSKKQKETAQKHNDLAAQAEELANDLDELDNFA